MERKFYTDDFEQLLKDNADDFRMYPSKRVWHSIYNDLHPGRKWPSIAGSIILITALFIAGYWNSNKSGESNSTTISNQSSPQNTAAAGLADKNINTSIASSSANSLYLQQLTLPQNNNHKINAVGTGTLYAEGGFKPGNNASQILASNNINQGAGAIGLNTRATSAAKGIVISPQDNADALHQNNFESDIAFQPNKSNVENKAIIITQNIEDEIATEKFEKPVNTALTRAEITSLSNLTETGNNPVNKSLPQMAFAAKTTLTAEDKAWIENYALHNKTERKKWKERSTLTFYATPNIGYRKLSNDSKYNVAPTTAPLGAVQTGVDADKAVNQKPGLGLEAGMNINYAVAKNLRLKVGVQGNYTNYSAKADETSHPVVTTLMMVDPNSGFPFMQATSTTLANSSVFKPVDIHNKTYQISIPLGLAYRLTGNDKMEWFAGGTIQPTLVLGGKAYLISADRKNYVADRSHMRKWNLNAGFESYINYKFDGFTLQAGPQFRYQILSTNFTKYTVHENLYNIGVKVGVVKNF